MKLAGNDRNVDSIGDCINKYGWTFFDKPGGDGSDCLFGQLNRILRILDFQARVKTEKSGGVAGGVGKWGDDVAQYVRIAL